MSAATFVYPKNWPKNPFHQGEVEVQKKLGAHEHVMSYAPKVIRPYMPDQHREFYEAQPFLVIAARDDQGCMWSSLLMSKSGQADFVTSPNETTLRIQARPLPGDALENSLHPGSDLGIIGIDFASKRRNRVNGRLVQSGVADTLEFRVDQSFGNCPQYIKPRRWWSSPNSQAKTSGNVSRSESLSELQIDKIKRSQTIFVASGYRGQGDSPKFGNDSSHRGGPAGFVKVQSPTKLIIPDFAGNNHYNTYGNLVLDPRMGVSFPQYQTGGMIQLTGTAKIDLDEQKAATTYPGAKRLIEFSIEQVVELPEGTLPVRWASDDEDASKRKLKVTKKVKESDNVMSFYLHPLEKDDQTLWHFQAGQHLPITLAIDKECVNTAGCEELMRTYSLSAGPEWGEYRISVKREELGEGSRFLHDSVEVGDVISVNKPAGDFVLDTKSTRTLVLLSAGIGVTPILSMLHKYVQYFPDNKRKAIWIHGARDGTHHPFKGEVLELKKQAGDSFNTHIVYSKPKAEDTEYDSTGRINAGLLSELVPDLKEADIYMCGTGAFMADIEDGLEKLGVDPKRIHFETF